MGLKWFLNFPFTQVLGHTDKVTCPNEGQVEGGNAQIRVAKEEYQNGFQMPLHYPKYTKADYEKMEEWKVDMLLKEYGLSFKGSLDEKRAFAMGTFLWPDQLSDSFSSFNA